MEFTKAMAIKVGLVGLPNVGKSTLFNALTKSSIPAENYPFCTIEPHVAITNVPDDRVEQLYIMYKSQKKNAATVTFVDIAGLVKGAADGQGLGNQFLSHIREVNLILHVLRCFDDKHIIREKENIDPLGDYEIIMSELILKDIDTINKRLEKMVKLIRGAQGKPSQLNTFLAEKELLENIRKTLDTGNFEKARDIIQENDFPAPSLLSTKNYLIIANISEDEIDNNEYENNKHYQKLIQKFGKDRIITLSAKTEYELSQMDHNQAKEMMDILGIKEKSLDIVIKKSYEHLGLVTFFTCGPQEIHAWPIPKKTTVRKAAGEIHSDLERGFICAEIFNYDDLAKLGSPIKVKELGKARREGQDYLVKDGDIIFVKFNV